MRGTLGLRAAASLHLHAGDRAVLRREDHDLPALLGLCQLLFERRHAALDLSKLRSRRRSGISRKVALICRCSRCSAACVRSRALQFRGLLDPLPFGFLETRLVTMSRARMARVRLSTRSLSWSCVRCRFISWLRYLLLVLERLDALHEIRRLVSEEALLDGLFRHMLLRRLVRRSTISWRVAPSASLCISVETARSGMPFLTSMPSLHMDLRDDARLRCENPHDALLRHQPAVDARFAGIGGEEQEAEHGGGCQQSQGGEHPMGDPRLQQNGSEPLGLMLDHDLRPEQRLNARRLLGLVHRL